MTNPTPEINRAFDDARVTDRELRDRSIDDELKTADRLARNLDERQRDSSSDSSNR